MSISAYATIQTSAVCDIAECASKLQTEKHVFVPLYPLSAPLHVTAEVPIGWHQLDGKFYCSAECLRAAIATINS